MSENLHIADTDLALYVMGALSDAEMRAAQLHLDACAQCREELRRDTLALGAYAQSVPDATLPANARQRFMARVAQTPQTLAEGGENLHRNGPSRQKPGFWQSLFGPGAWSPILVGSLAVALIAVGFDDMRRRVEMKPLFRQAQRGAIDSAQLAQLMDLLTSPTVKKVALHQTPQATPPPEGRVVYAVRTGKLLLTASNLHPLPAGKVYELWILQPNGGKPLPAGTFSPDSSGYASMVLASAPAGLAVQGFGVTVENEGGAQTPTLPIVLSGL